MNLMDIQDAVQQIADAISAVLHIEVEIADAQLIRVAGTGRTKQGVLNKMEGDLVYRSALRTGQRIVIDNPGYHEACEHCTFVKRCPETGEICTPIVLDGRVIGVIGLLAFDDHQRQILFGDLNSNHNFLDKMAELIASKLQESNVIAALKDTSERLYKITNMVDHGIVILSSEGAPVHLNTKAESLLQVSGAGELPEDTLEALNEFVHSRTPNERDSLSLLVGDITRDFLCYHLPLQVNGGFPQTIFAMQAMDDIRQFADISSDDMKRSFNKIVGRSVQMQQLKEYAYRVSRSTSTVVIEGESGTGKEEFARAIHYASGRRTGPFIPINCGAIPESLLESELFGYAPGAFTGAARVGKPGKFELANNGTLFLDEIGEMPMLLQVKLLRAIQERYLERVGSTSPIPIDVRIITATNANLRELVEKGKFREDLFYRLNVIPILLPPLRNRPEDIAPLTDHFIEVFNHQFGAKVLGLSPEVRSLLRDYTWPGNVRELKNLLEFLFNFVSEGLISMDRAGALIKQKLLLEKAVPPGTGPAETLSLRAVERETILRALEYVRNRGQKVEDASQLLGIGRATLFRKIKQLGLN